MISDEYFILRKANIFNIEDRNADHYHYVYKKVEMFLLELQYNSSNKNVQLVIHNLKLNDTIYDLDAFNKNNIIFIDKEYIYFYNLVNTNMNLISKISIIGNFDPYFIIADKLNQQIILLNSYEYNLLLSYNIDNKSFYYSKINVKKNFRGFIRDWRKGFKILNKDTYLLSINNNSIYLISSKYLELICEYDFEYKFDNYFILNNMNMIFFIYKSHIAIYKFEKGELNLYKKKNCKYYEKMIDIKNINDKGDHILAIQKVICKFKVNISRLYYIKNNGNLDYPFLSDDNLNGYEDDLYDYYEHKYVPYKYEEYEEYDEYEESDESSESEEFFVSYGYSNPEESNNPNESEYDEFDKYERECDNYYDKRHFKNKKIKELKQIKDKKNKNKRISKFKNSKVSKKEKKKIKYNLFF